MALSLCGFVVLNLKEMLCLELFAPLGLCARAMGIFHPFTWSRWITGCAEAVLVSLEICCCFKILGTSGGVILGPSACAAAGVGSSRDRGRMWWCWPRCVCVPCEMGGWQQHPGWLCFCLEWKCSWAGKTQLSGVQQNPRQVISSVLTHGEAGVSGICHPSSAAPACLVVGAACLWHTWEAGSSGATQDVLSKGCRGIDVLGANPVYLLCQHLQHVSILPEKHRVFLPFDSVQCSLPALIIASLFSCICTVRLWFVLLDWAAL